VTVGIVVVSHSASIATGVVDLARQMAPDVHFAAAGGTEDGGIGTSFDAITAAITSVSDQDEVVVLCDLGSAYLTTDTALEFLDDEVRERVSVSRSPLVEGTVAAAVAAQTGGDAAGVLAAAATAETVADEGAETVADEGSDVVPPEPAGARAEVALVNASGLHARPAAEFVKTASKFGSTVRVNGTDAKSLLAIMAMGLAQGTVLTIEATGSDAADAVAALVELVETGFGEE
jgi:PTS hybrid protein